ncbi:hypothetical protein Scep_022894 [Stephania cephalantha]|uniref:C2 domain-containing protein n=1 Tax=Stephania cephalantha TaxID=152367 RepID=A0AAP0I2L6_9MAGN
MEKFLGLLRIHVIRGTNLAIRDTNRASSDPYVTFNLGKQKLKTHVVKKNLNPEWNDDLTMCITDPKQSIKLAVYDHDTFSFDDKMGDSELDIEPFMEAVKMKLEGLPNGTIIRKLVPSRQNCLAEESPIYMKDNKVMQDLCLRLRNVECGEVEIQLEWIDLPGSKAI